MTHTPDRVTAKDSGQQYLPHPAGQIAMRCVDVVNLGERLETFQGKVKIQPKCALVFRSAHINRDTNQPYEVNVEFTVSMHERASLRQFLEKWRGKPYSEKQAKDGVPIDKLAGQPGFCSVVHKQSSSGRTYARIDTIMPVPDGISPPPVWDDYKRPDFWDERKKQYAEEVQRYRGQNEVVAQGDYEDGNGNGEDDDLPF